MTPLRYILPTLEGTDADLLRQRMKERHLSSADMLATFEVMIREYTRRMPLVTARARVVSEYGAIELLDFWQLPEWVQDTILEAGERELFLLHAMTGLHSN